jgi:uncharacterized phage-associated protein
MKTSFDKEKAVQALIYIADKAPKPDYIHIVKILYFAEKDHLQKYGRMIISDDYKRLQWGPVPTRSYDLLKLVANRGDSHFLDMNPDIARAAKSSLKVEANGDPKFEPLCGADLDVFSKSDLKCLDAAIEKYGSMSFVELTDESHDEVWKMSRSFDITFEDIISTFPNRDALLQYVHAPD